MCPETLDENPCLLDGLEVSGCESIENSFMVLMGLFEIRVPELIFAYRQACDTAVFAFKLLG